MRKWFVRIGISLSALILVTTFGAFTALPALVDYSLNQVKPVHSPAISQEASQVHASLVVADLHSDSLLWGRDILVRSNRGHVDIPRLIEGNVALQVFTVVTKTPKSMNYENNTDEGDNITALTVLQRWPRATWSSLLERALFQSQRFSSAVERSEGGLVPILTAGDIDEFLEQRRKNPRVVAGLLGIEGLHCLEGKIENVDLLYRAGFRMMGLTHFFDNELGGSAHGVSKAGLTDFGRQVVKRMEELNIVVDLAHASPAMIDEVLAMSTRPLVVSHTGVKGTCDRTRNLSFEHVRKVAAKGGLIGIGYWEEAVCGEDVRAIVDAIKYTSGLAGIDHVSLGSDFDGATTVPFDTSDLAALTQEMITQGFTEDDIGKVMGGNVIQFLRKALPAS